MDAVENRQSLRPTQALCVHALTFPVITEHLGHLGQVWDVVVLVLPLADGLLVLVQASDPVHAKFVLVVGAALPGLPERIGRHRERIHLLPTVRFRAVLVEAVPGDVVAAQVGDVVFLLIILLQGRQLMVLGDRECFALCDVALVVDVGWDGFGAERH